MKRKHRRNKRNNSPLLRVPKIKAGIASIKVVGVGGGGGNAVTRMMEDGRVKGVEFVAINTDAQDLNYATAHKKLYIGKALTRGLGAGMNPEIGKQAAEENRSEISEALEGADIVFITAGFGGGTGSGASPVIAEAAREKGILTVAIVTKPFTFEGAERSKIAQEALGRIKDKVDALVIIPNDRVFSLISKDTSVAKAFGFVDDVLKQGVQAIAELINFPGIINVDFSDIKAIIRDAGTTHIGIGIAAGSDRSIKAVNAAINSPLLEYAIDGAKRVLFSVAGGKDMKMSEVNDVAKAISANLDSNARVIFGAYYDRQLKDKSLKVTLIASGFNGIFNNGRMSNTLFVEKEPGRDEAEIKLSVETPLKGLKDEKAKKNANQKSDSWEIPAFLRKKRR